MSGSSERATAGSDVEQLFHDVLGVQWEEWQWIHEPPCVQTDCYLDLCWSAFCLYAVEKLYSDVISFYSFANWKLKVECEVDFEELGINIPMCTCIDPWRAVFVISGKDFLRS
jgi:hypothetical protein